VGPVIATAMAALAPPAETFKRGRDFAAWLGLTPLQHSTGGKQRLGATSKMGERTLRRLLIIARARWCVGPREKERPRLVACEHDRTQARDAGESCIGEQNGPRHLALMAKGGDLPGSGRGVNLLTIVGLSRRRRSNGKYGAIIGEMGSENQLRRSV